MVGLDALFDSISHSPKRPRLRCTDGFVGTATVDFDLFSAESSVPLRAAPIEFQMELADEVTVFHICSLCKQRAYLMRFVSMMHNTRAALAITLLVAVGGFGCTANSRPAEEAPPSEAPAVPATAPPPVPAAEPFEPEITGSVPEGTVSTSSVLESFDASGILRAVSPGWHSKNPASYPEWVQVRFETPREIRQVSLLAQHENGARAPRRFDVQTSADGRKWVTATTVENGCDGEAGRWRDYPLPMAVNTRWLRLLIAENCGDPQLVTLRGLKVE
jgi:hypothetical protein